MIERKLKPCRGCNTPQFLFSGGLCKTCWGRGEALNKGKWGLPTPKKRSSSHAQARPLKTRSDKRKLEEMEYFRRVKEMEDTMPDKVCYFCSKKIDGEWDRHHLMGRDGVLIYDTDQIVFVHRGCHTDYHSLSVNRLSWHRAWLGKLLWDDRILLYNKEKSKYEK